MGKRAMAVITGASSGIGADFARVLAERGYDCVITARRVDRLEALAEELREKHGVEVHVIAADLGIAGGADKLYRDATALGGKITFLVNNAGFGLYGDFVDQDPKRILEMIQLNITSLTELTRSFAAKMKEQGEGRILQVASVGAFQPSPLYAVYSATKSYVRDFSQAANFELRGSGVSITTICPGVTESEFHAKADHLKPKSIEAVMMSARSVAEIGIRAAENRRATVTPGLVNKLMEWWVAWTPRSIATWAAGVSMRSRREPDAADTPSKAEPAKQPVAKKKKAKKAASSSSSSAS